MCSSPLITLVAIHQFVNLSLALEGPKLVTSIKEKDRTTSLDLLSALSII